MTCEEFANFFKGDKPRDYTASELLALETHFSRCEPCYKFVYGLQQRLLAEGRRPNPIKVANMIIKVVTALAHDKELS